MAKTVLITGGAGFIGSHVAESLVKKGYNVRIFDNFSSGSKENLNAIKNDVQIIKGDILDLNGLLKAMKRVDIVSHHAAQLEIIRCLDYPIEDLKINTIGTLNVLLAALKYKATKFINISSACVYGQAQTIPEKEDRHPLFPNWPYGVSKLATERYTHLYNDRISTTSLRYAIVYGEREWYGRVLTMFLKRALNRKPPVVFGDGKQVRDFIYVGDVVRLHNSCINNNVSDGKIYNVSTGIGTRIANLAKTVCHVTKLGAKPIFENIKEGVKSKIIKERIRLPFELKEMVLCNKKAKDELGWKPNIALHEGNGREYEWLKQNKKRWEFISI